MMSTHASTLAVFDPNATSMLVGAGLVAVSGWIGWVAGRISGRNQTARRQGPTSELICSCGHGYGTHEDEKRCHGVDAAKRNGVHTLDPCSCRLYDGPEPLPRTWTPVQLPNAE
ncbi:hypothetical protein GCM10009609_66970 [Pseudonocardia aurantiaca]|uniref:Uncharacterized protein n=1 Tax=Pseudonocardia aurantiaca TaxID=75290 RepID=A0ABW4FR15_9PSEU